MKNITPQHCHKTSVSLPHMSYRRLSAARKIFARNGIVYSDQEIYRRLFKHYLKNWRGRGRKTNGLRRYNADGKLYEIHPLYINQVLYALLWQRALHSGESVSRMLDVAIRVYLPRLLEELLCQSSPGMKLTRNATYWDLRYARRIHQYADFFINYRCKTEKNDAAGLEYSQSAKIFFKADILRVRI